MITALLVSLFAAVLQERPSESAPAPIVMSALPGDSEVLVREVRIEGVKRLSEEALRLQLRTKAGHPWSAEQVDLDLKTLAAKYQVLGETRKELLPDGGVRVVFLLSEMESVRRIKFVGNDELDEDELRKALQLSENGVLPAGMILGQGLAILVRRLREKYEEEGYLYAEIDARPEKEGDDWVLVFHVLEGPHVVVDQIEFDGAEEFEPGFWEFWQEHPLRSLMKTSRSYWLFTSAYKPKVVQDDCVKIEQFLHDEGYLDARVALESVTANAAADEVDLRIRIDQGPRYTVRSVKLAGNQKFSTEELSSLVKLAPGMVFRQTLYAKDRSRLLKRYRHEGYVRCAIPTRPGYTYGQHGAEVDVTIKIDEDERKRVRDVIVLGNADTRDDVVRRELDLSPHDLFDGDEMVKAEDRLRTTGFFLDDHNQPMAWVEQKETADPAYEDLVMRVQDDSNGLFTIFGGVASGTGAFLGTDLSIENFDIADPPSSPGALFEEFLDHKAFHGGGQKLRIRANPGNRYSNYLVQFREPYLLGPQERPVFLDVSGHVRESINRFYQQETIGGVLTIGKALSREASLSLGLRQDRITIDHIEARPDPIEDLLAVDGGTSVRGLVSDWDWQRVDSLRNTTDGVRAGATLEWLGGPIGAQVDAVKLSGFTEFLIPVWENAEEQRHVLSLRGAAAFEDPYGDDRDVPYFERFFAGGPSTFLQLRGFQYRGVGPHDGNFGVGGTVGATVNTEYVFPLVDTYDARIRESVPFLRGLVFVDQGILESEWSDLHSGKWRSSAGVGLRLRLPIQLFSAPLEIYYGIPLARAHDDERESFQINFSTRF